MGSATAISFLGFLAAFVVIGLYSAIHKKDTPDDYLVASRSVNPWLAALSAVATNNSGFMFMGLIGETFAYGISAAWLMIGWIGGDWIAWTFVHRRVRSESERLEVASIPSFIAGGDGASRPVAVVAGLITLIFLAIYASAQLVAGGKALFAVSGWPVELGIVMGAAMVAAYCFSGGIRASIWTDVAQSVVMLGAMLLVVALAISHLGGWSAMWSALGAIDNGSRPRLTELAPSGYKFGIVGYVLGWFGAGFGAVGQPHVMIRAMAVDSPDSVPKMRRIYVTWYAVFAAACIAVGLAARILLGSTVSLDGATPYDPELALLDLAGVIQLAPVLIGLVLAGLFAATISTADSQILSCSAAVTRDIVPGWGKSYVRVKMATLGVAAFAMVAALFGGSVFSIVTLAWATLAAGLGPLMVLRAFRRPLTTPIALATMLSGIAANMLWRFGLAWHGDLYDVLPGMATGFAVYFVLAYATREPRAAAAEA